MEKSSSFCIGGLQSKDNSISGLSIDYTFPQYLGEIYLHLV